MGTHVEEGLLALFKNSIFIPASPKLRGLRGSTNGLFTCDLVQAAGWVKPQGGTLSPNSPGLSGHLQGGHWGSDWQSPATWAAHAWAGG